MSKFGVTEPTSGPRPRPDPPTTGGSTRTARYNLLAKLFDSNASVAARASGGRIILMDAVRTMLTMEEFLELPELDAGKRELLRGELIELPPAKRKHNQVAHRMQKWLDVAVPGAG